MSDQSKQQQALQSLEQIIRALPLAQRKVLKAEIFNLIATLELLPTKYQYLIQSLTAWPHHATKARRFLVEVDDDYGNFKCYAATSEETRELFGYTINTLKVMLGTHKGRLPPDDKLRMTKFGNLKVTRMDEELPAHIPPMTDCKPLPTLAERFQRRVTIPKPGATG